MRKPLILMNAVANPHLRGLKDSILSHDLEVREIANWSGVDHCLRARIRPDLFLLHCHRAQDTQAGLQAAARLRNQDRRFPIILLAGQGSEDLAVAALRIGIKDYYRTPFVAEDIVSAIKRCLARNRPDQRLVSLAAGTELIGASPALCRAKDFLAKAALVDSNILITGETGTGKELAAEYVHSLSPRRHHPFITINCAALSDTLLEGELFGYEKGLFASAQCPYPGKLRLAEGGTAFFDEIGDMSPYAQARISRVLENREVRPVGGERTVPLNIRIIAATSRNLEDLLGQNRFRPDLYFRINVGRVNLPPLRERREDIPLLVDHYLRQLNRKWRRTIRGFSDEVLDVFMAYEWPGNVRELKNLVEAVFIDPPTDAVTLSDLPDVFKFRYQSQQPNGLSEREQLLSALDTSNWNKSKAAEKLRCSRMTLYRKMEKYAIAHHLEEMPNSEDPENLV